MVTDLQGQIVQLRRTVEFAQQRERLLARIDSVIRVAKDPTEITHAAAQLLGGYLGVDRCAYAEVAPDQDQFNVIGSFVDHLPSMVGKYRLSQFSSLAYELLAAGEPFVIEDSETDQRCSSGIQAFRAAGVRAAISCPLMREGRLTAILSVDAKHPRRWDSEEVALVAAVTTRCWESMERQRILRDLERDREQLRRKSAEIERQHAELKTIYDTAPIGLAYFDLNDYHYLRLNDRQAAFFGLTPAEIVGKTLTDMAPIPGRDCARSAGSFLPNMWMRMLHLRVTLQ